MNLKNRTSCLFKIVLFIIFSIFVAEIIVLPKIEHDMLKEAGRQELVTVQQLCGAVLEKNPDVEQDFILGLRQPTKSWQEKGEQILNQYGYDEEHLRITDSHWNHWLHQPYQYNDYEYFSSQKGIGNFAGNRFV